MVVHHSFNGFNGFVLLDASHGTRGGTDGRAREMLSDLMSPPISCFVA